MQVFSIERVVVLLSPVLTALATFVVGWVAQNIPGAPALHASDVRDVEILVILGTYSLILKWLHGRQKPELIALEKARPAPPQLVTQAPSPIPTTAQ